jgi:PAS domain-containing protein
MALAHSGWSELTQADENELASLVNRLAQELAEAQRVAAAAMARLTRTSRQLEVRTQDLTESRAALALLLASLDCNDDGMIAFGHFGRAMHYNSRFVEIWQIGQERLATLNEPALLALQLAQVRDPDAFQALAGQRKARPDEKHGGAVELHDGRVLRCDVLPQRVGGKRVGWVTRFRDVSTEVHLRRELESLRAGLPA